MSWKRAGETINLLGLRKEWTKKEKRIYEQNEAPTVSSAVLGFYDVNWKKAYAVYAAQGGAQAERRPPWALVFDKGFQPRTLRHFDAGYDKDDQRITIPVWNEQKKLLGMLGRACRQTEFKYVPYNNFHYCTPAETPILMGDFSFKPISMVRPGDVVMGWEQNSTALTALGKTRQHTRRGMVQSRVMETSRLKARPVVKIICASGRTLRATADHFWLTYRDGAARNTLYRQAAVGRKLCHFVDVPSECPPNLIRTAGWLGGIYDGEGSGIYLAQSRSHNPQVWEGIRDALDDLNFDFGSDERGHWLRGGKGECIRFINWCRPLRSNSMLHCRSTGFLRNGGGSFTPDEIVSIEEDGVEPVYALETTTGNYVAWGYASKNSDHVYNLCHTQEGESVILVEGAFDVWMLWQWGIPFTALATMTSHISDAQITQIAEKHSEVCVFYDGDAAGFKGAATVARALTKKGVQVEVMFPPKGLENIKAMNRTLFMRQFARRKPYPCRIGDVDSPHNKAIVPSRRTQFSRSR